MTPGRAQTQAGFQDPREILGDRLREGSRYRLLADHGHQMFPDDYFADLYAESMRGRPNASTSATVEVVLGDAAPGAYRGHVLARGLLDVALPVRSGPGVRRRVISTVRVTDQSDPARPAHPPASRNGFKQTVSIVKSWTGRFSRRCLRKSGAGWSLGSGGGPIIAMK